ncbi:MAG TPA: TlpA disulfide reductase family protein [Actinomycetota bacterium]|nr:TlpA disulfide reductase family protein [Actinomycetota bacterium]
MNSPLLEAEPPAAEPNGITPRRIKFMRMLAFLIVPSLFVGFLAVGMTIKSDSQQVIGKRAPSFDLSLVSGGTLSSKDLEGHPVVINFWASWCQPCREEAPTLEAKWQKFRDQGVMIVGVNVQDRLEDAAAFQKEFGLTFPSVRDSNLKLFTSFGVRGMPETFFIDHTWTFRGLGETGQTGQQGTFKILGAVQPAVLEREINDLLELQGRG